MQTHRVQVRISVLALALSVIAGCSGSSDSNVNASSLGGSMGSLGGSMGSLGGGTSAANTAAGGASTVATVSGGGTSMSAGGVGAGGTPTGGRSFNATGGIGQGGSMTSSGGTSSGGKTGNGGSPSAGGSSGSDSSATFLPDPSWTCGMPSGIPSPTLGKLVFHATLQLGATHDVGATPYGRRRINDVKGGTVKGDKITATVVTGGLDLELTLSNGAIELEEINILKASDGTLIYLRSCGVAPSGESAVRIVPDFEVATSNSLAWLNTGKFAGTRVLDATAGAIALDVYDISTVSAGSPTIQLKDPSGVPNQAWECATATGAKGASVFTETVTLGGSLSVGASKRGTRNIVPITGGTVTGRFTGTVLAGGADYQLLGSSTKLDARYTLASNDGEFVLVRNCGPFGALIPQFETRATGAYSFLNTNAYLSSDPGSAGSGVSITFYERK